VDWSPGLLGELGEAEDVIDVAVRHEDRRTARAERCEPEPKLRRRAAWIDDDCLGRRSVGAYDVAVRRERAERELFDDRRHDRECTDVLRFRRVNTRARLHA
jgi:hypothetical protein